MSKPRIDRVSFPIVAFTGHRIGDRFRPEREGTVARALAERIGSHGVRAGFGSLADGADILVAEALVEAGAELHLYLPMAAARFVDGSVSPVGNGWRRRFAHCLARATSIVEIPGGDGDHDLAYQRCAHRFMDAALQRARAAGCRPLLIAVWNGEPPGATQVAGAAADVHHWRSLGLPVETLSPAG